LRILHVINNLKREGAQVMVFNLVTSSAAGQARHFVCVREPGGALQPALERRGIPVFAPDRYHNARSTRVSLRFIDRIIGNEAIDIVHAHMADAAFLAWLAARKRRLPLVITHHGHDILPACNGSILCRTVYAVLLGLAARYARRNIAVAPMVADTVRRRLWLGRDRVTVIANGVPVPAPGAATRDAGRGLRIVTVGRLVDLKGQEQLIAAAAKLVGEYRNLRVFIVGDGPLRESLHQKTGSLGLGDNIVFTGSVDDVPARLRQADVYVSTSHFEGMPVATLEAMAWQVPVIASDVPGNRDVIEHGRTGLLYPAGDIAALAEAIRQVAEAPEPARERAHRARQSVDEGYSAEAAGRAYERLYGDILKEWRRPDRMPAV
jgi:glycosyltransferase involved in cell wall biosynthesis